MKKQDHESDREVEIAAQFPEIEHLLETEDFQRINDNFTAAYQELEKLGKGRGGLGKSREARKAMKAIERVMDLLRHLLKLKYEMGGSGDSTPHRKK